jgi:hypothetical protein
VWRVLLLLSVAVTISGCGGRADPTASPRSHGDSVAVTFLPAEPDGFWRAVERSPDLKWWLGQWSGDCEAQETFVIPAKGGKPRRILPSGAESYALGWSGRRARIRLPHAACGGNGELQPGVYLVDPRTLKLTRERVRRG